MGMLLRTTEANKHWHLIYFDDQSKQFSMSTDDEHTHEVSLYPDPLTSQPRIAVAMGGDDPHTHDVQALKPALPAKPKKKDDEEVVKHAIGLFKHAVKIEEQSRLRAKESFDFFKGEHWTEQERSELNAKGRAAQVYNYVQSFVDSLSGLARQNRLDPRAYPVEGSDNGVADIVTTTLSWVAKRANLSTQEIRVFEDEIIAGRGLFHVTISQKNNPLGDVVIERFPWMDGYLGAHHELDASDATHAHKAKWISLQEAQARYPHKAEELETQLKYSEEYPEELSEQYSFTRMLMADGEVIDKLHQRLRLVEHEIKETRQALVVADEAGTMQQEVDYQTFNKAETIPGLRMMEFPKDRIRIVVTVGGLLLKNYYPDRPYEGFSIVPVYAYKFDDNDWCGKVEAMKDAQREINKRGSQAIDIVNRMLGQFWLYDDETFNDDRDKNQFKRDAGKPGALLKVATTDRPPVSPDRPNFPTELLNMHRQNVETMQSISNIPPAMAGTGTGYESGDALQIQKSSGLVGNERVFDNFVLSKQTVFKKVFALVKKFYTPDRIARLVLSAASDPSRMEQVQLGGQEVPMQRSPEEDAELQASIIKMLDTADLEEYDIAIGEQPLSPTAREAQFRLWMEARNHGLPVPPGLLMDLSSLPNKGKYAREMQAMQEQQMQMEQQKFTAEMAKAGRIPVNQ